MEAKRPKAHLGSEVGGAEDVAPGIGQQQETHKQGPGRGGEAVSGGEAVYGPGNELYEATTGVVGAVNELAIDEDLDGPGPGGGATDGAGFDQGRQPAADGPPRRRSCPTELAGQLGLVEFGDDPTAVIGGAQKVDEDVDLVEGQPLSGGEAG